MRSIFLVGAFIHSILTAASADALVDRLATGFIAGPSPGHYWAMSSAYRASFDPMGIQLFRHGRRAAIRFPGARLHWQGEGDAGVKVNFLGAEIRAFDGSAAMRARNAYPGVDIVVRLNDGRLKSEFQLAAGVSPAVARYCLEGATVRAGNAGQSLTFDAGGAWRWTESGLQSWQDARDGKKLPVHSRFRVSGQCVRFRVSNVDPSLPLTIDPELVFSSYMGGGMFDAITAVATDAQGNLYLGGWTESSDFPSLSGYRSVSAGRIDGFVAKVNASGQLIFSTYLGGVGEDRVQAIVVDGAGVITVAGLTSSTNFPTLSPVRGSLAGGRDAFVTRLNPAGNQLVFSTYLGGSAHDAALALALDFSGNIVVGGETSSTDFPTQSAYSATSGGGVDGFLSRFSPSGDLLSSTYLGGGADDRIRGIAVGGNGALHVTGSTASSNFPVIAAPYPSLRGSMDAFYTRLNSTSSGLSLSTYLGGAGGSSLSEEAGYGITIDSLGRAWIAGVTPSTDFPGVSSGNQTTYGGGTADAFVSVFSAAGSLEWSTFLGGTGLDAATSISAGSGFVGLAGYTTSSNLPVTGALQTARAGEYDAFWAAFPIGSTVPLFLSYLGGTGSDSALAVSASGGALAIGGSTLSANFPLQSPLQSSNPGSYGGFVSRLRFGPGPISVSPASGNGQAGIFTFSISHVNGSATIQNAGFLFNNTFSFTAGCYVYYDRTANLVSLYKDSGPVWLSLTPGSAASIDNGVCAVSGAGVTVTSSVNSLVLTLPVTFAASFGGTRNIYANANDSVSLGAGWPQVGAWDVVAASAPAVGVVAPASGNGSVQSFSFTFSDANGAADINTAAFLLNNAISNANGCYITYTRASNTVALFRDADSSFLSLTPGAAASVENTNCSVSGAGITVTRSGTQLAISVPLSFKAPFSGTKNVYASATDAGGLSSGWQSVGTWKTSADYAPALLSVQPASGTGLSQTFAFQFADANGYADIDSIAFLFNTTLNTANACYLTYSRAANTLSLFRDSDASWITLAPGSPSTVENNNCSIAGSAFSISASDNNVHITMPVTFKAGLFGSLTVYAVAADRSGLSSGWISAGTWSAAGPATPSVTSVSPDSGSATAQTFTVSVSDANGSGDIATAAFMLNTAVTPYGGCYLSYSRVSNTIYLLRDSDSVWQPLTPGVNVTVENVNCSLSGASVVVTSSGSTLTFSLPLTFKAPFTGIKNFYALVVDAGGLTPGWQRIGTWNPSALPPAAPSVGSFTPNAGSGTAQTFTVSLSDPNGTGDIASAGFLLNTAITPYGGCYLSYTRASNTVYLLRDSDSVWQSLIPGANVTVENANCSLSGGSLTVTASGNTLTFTLPLTFKVPFTGVKNFYALVVDAGNLTPGWQRIGTWNPSAAPPAAPAIGTFSPNAGFGTAQTFTVTLSDANGNGDIATAGFMLNTAITPYGGCYLSYSRAANTIYLLRDSDSAWQPLTPGANITVENVNCSISGAGLSITGSGNTLTFTLPLSFKPSFTGLKNFYALVVDAGGLTPGWQRIGAWSPSALSPSVPTIGSFSPNAGSGAAQTFTVTLSDGNGNGDIASAGFMLNTAITAYGGCYLSYTRASNTVYLLRDSDSVWQPLTPGANITVENVNCTLSGGGLTVAASGNSLTFTLPLTFKVPFAGVKNFYALVVDAGNLTPGWQRIGTWNPSAPPPAAPTIASLAPNAGSGRTQTFSVTLSDANGNADIAAAGFMLNNVLTPYGGCYLSYSRALNIIYLLRDSDSAWQPLTPGSNITVENANCSLSGAALTVTATGNNLTFSLPLTFKAPFTGVKNFYALVVDAGGLTPGWLLSGTWGEPIIP